MRSAGALVAFGGYNGKYHNSVQVYRPGERPAPFNAMFCGTSALQMTTKICPRE